MPMSKTKINVYVGTLHHQTPETPYRPDTTDPTDTTDSPEAKPRAPNPGTWSVVRDPWLWPPILRCF